MQDLLQELTEKRKMLDDCIDSKKKLGRKLARAEFDYKVARSKMIAHLNIVGLETEEGNMKPLAITTCEGMSQGIEPVSSLRLERDMAKFDYDVLQEKIWQSKIEINIIQSQMEAERKGL